MHDSQAKPPRLTAGFRFIVVQIVGAALVEKVLHSLMAITQLGDLIFKAPQGALDVVGAVGIERFLEVLRDAVVVYIQRSRPFSFPRKYG